MWVCSPVLLWWLWLHNVVFCTLHDAVAINFQLDDRLWTLPPVWPFRGQLMNLNFNPIKNKNKNAIIHIKRSKNIYFLINIQTFVPRILWKYQPHSGYVAKTTSARCCMEPTTDAAVFIIIKWMCLRYHRARFLPDGGWTSRAEKESTSMSCFMYKTWKDKERSC